MPDQTLKCPYCSREIPLTEALSNQLKEGIKKEYESRARQQELEIARREDGIRAKAREVEESKKALDETVARKLALERPRVQKEAEERAREGLQVAMRDLQEENSRKDTLLAESMRQELDLRKRARELEEEKKSLDLIVARKLDDEREKIKQNTLEMFSEEHRLKDMEKDKMINGLRRNIEELKRKSEQGPVQVQGEVLEESLEALLKARFPADVIEAVPKGIKGADILQKVYTRAGLFSGCIAWELKRTKAWNDEWITKLKDDQREVKAEVAVLVTEAMPKGLSAFSQMEGVWVTGVSLAAHLAEVLRVGLMQVAQSRLSATGKNEKMEAVYNYLSGSEFRQRIEAIAESFKAMKEDLDQEKRAMARIWAKREKQIERAFTNTISMYGDMQGIIHTLPEIKVFELAPGVDDPDGADDAKGL